MKHEKTYDAALAEMIDSLSAFIIPLINFIFGEHFTDDSAVTLLNNKHIIHHLDGNLSKRETDVLIKIAEKLYHIECETWYDKGIILRFVEYDSLIALKNAVPTEDGVDVFLPDSAVIFLRPNEIIPDVLKINYKLQDGSFLTHGIPVVQMSDFTVGDIFENKLLILLPFYLFKFSNELDTMDSSRVSEELNKINESLWKLYEVGEIDSYQKMKTQELLLRVSEKLIGDNDLMKGVNDIMYGDIARTRADEILDKGRAEGREEGRAEGREEGRTEGKRLTANLFNFLWSHGRGEDAIKAGNDESYLNQLLEEYINGALA